MCTDPSCSLSLQRKSTKEYIMPQLEKEIPLVVDLDGALVRTDMLWESILHLVKEKPIYLFKLPLWLLGGKKKLKTCLADSIRPSVALFPYFQPLLEYLKEQKELGKKLILASASDARIVQNVADHLGIFDLVMGTTQEINLRGNNKLKLIKKTLGEGAFDYVGNERADIPIWRESREAIAVTRSKRLISHVRKIVGRVKVFTPPMRPLVYVKAFRIHQWIKNLLIFLPFFLAHEPFTGTRLFILFSAFFAMSFCASAVYICNDLFDLDADRHHSIKRNRPFASGMLSIRIGAVLSFTMLLSSFCISWFILPKVFSAFLLGYLLLTSLYTLVIKKLLLIDVIALSSFYVLRIFSGGVAGNIELSPWLLACSSFFFLNLAFAKRYVELNEFQNRSENKLVGRNYRIEDMQIIVSAGLASGYISVLIFFLYIANSVKVNQLYKNPDYLWFIGPMLIYWLTRIWILAQRGELHSDPVHFAVKDPVSWTIGFLSVALIVLGAVM